LSEVRFSRCFDSVFLFKIHNAHIRTVLLSLNLNFVRYLFFIPFNLKFMKHWLIYPLVILGSCSPKPSTEESKAKVIQTEKDFAQMAKEKGIAAAFYTFADSHAVIKRGNQLVKGKEAIKDYYSRQTQRGELQWSPTFADVSGDLGYTYGEFTYSEKDSVGNLNESKGYFHTVWKRQKDGSWKFVWD